MVQNKAWFRFGFSALLLAASACAAQGPGDGSEADEPGTEEAQAPLSGERPRADKGHHRGGDKLIRAALAELDLSDAQRSTIAALEKDLPGKPEEMKDFMTALAAGVRANAIDEAQMTAKIDALSRQGTAMRAQHAATLEKLHATLTSAQRKELVEKVRERMEEKEERFAEMRERFEDGGEEAGPRGKGGKGGKLRGGPLAHIMKKLDLSDEQRDAVKKAVTDAGVARPDREAMKAKFEAMRASKKAMLDAFATEDFDADKLLPEHDGKGGEHLASMVKVTKSVLPILTAAQRDKLAEVLESGDMWKGKHKKHGAPVHETE